MNWNFYVSFFELKILRVRFSNQNLTCQIFNEKFYNLWELELKILQCFRNSVTIFTAL